MDRLTRALQQLRRSGVDPASIFVGRRDATPEPPLGEQEGDWLVGVREDGTEVWGRVAVTVRKGEG